MKKYTLVLTTLFVIGFAFTSCDETKKDANKVETEEVKVAVEKVAEEAENKEMAMTEYQCPMNCEDGKTYKEPGQCPKCEMDLKKVEKTTEVDEENHEGHDHE